MAAKDKDGNPVDREWLTQKLVNLLEASLGADDLTAASKAADLLSKMLPASAGSKAPSVDLAAIRKALEN